MALTREEQIREIDERAKKDKGRWILIMLVLMLVAITLAALVSVLWFAAAPIAVIAGIIALAIIAKLCMAEVSKINQRHRNDLNKLDNKGHY